MNSYRQNQQSCENIQKKRSEIRYFAILMSLCSFIVLIALIMNMFLFIIFNHLKKTTSTTTTTTTSIPSNIFYLNKVNNG